MESTNTWCINRDLLDKYSLLNTWNEILNTRGTPVTRIEFARMLDAITKQQYTNGWDAWNSRPINSQRKQMNKEITLQDLLEQIEEFGLKVKSEFDEAVDALDKPSTVEELDEQTDIDTGCERDVCIFKSQHELTGVYEDDGPFFKDVESCFYAGMGMIESSCGAVCEILSPTTIRSVGGGISTQDRLLEESDLHEECEDCDKEDEAPKPINIPKWKAVELQLLDVIGNTLGSETAIDSERATTLLLLAQTRESILRNPR